MERNIKIARKSLSLGNRINKRRSASSSQEIKNEYNSHRIAEPKSPPHFLEPETSTECTPPHKKHLLDDSIEYSPVLNNSFSPSTLYSQSIIIDSAEVGWRWEKEKPKVEPQVTISDAKSFEESKEKCSKTKCSQTKREQQLRAIEIKIRRDQNIKADELLKRRCAKFKLNLHEAENQNTDKKHNTDSIKKIVKNPSAITDNKVPIPAVLPSFEDFFNDSGEDDFLLEATEQVEHEMVKLSQQRPEQNHIIDSTPTNHSENKERRSSLYTKFFEDDPDDLFEAFDDIIAHAMESTKSRNSFQRYNSMPIESMSPKSKHVGNVPGRSKPLNKTTKENHTIKRHASSHDVPIYHPQKIKQIRKI